jgi:hypothetical protein
MHAEATEGSGQPMKITLLPKTIIPKPMLHWIQNSEPGTTMIPELNRECLGILTVQVLSLPDKYAMAEHGGEL